MKKHIRFNGGTKVSAGKKALALILSCTLISTCFAGCSKKSKSVLNSKNMDNILVMTIDDKNVVGDERIVLVENSGYTHYPTGDIECRGKHYKDVMDDSIYHIIDITKEKWDSLTKGQKYRACGAQLDDSEVEAKPDISYDQYCAFSHCKNSSSFNYSLDDVTFNSVVDVATAEELNKIKNGKFSDDDSIDMQNRLNKELKNKTK